MDTKEAGRLGGLKGGRSKSPAKLAGLARARAARLGRIAARKSAQTSLNIAGLGTTEGK